MRIEIINIIPILMDFMKRIKLGVKERLDLFPIQQVRIM
jgi:hypothetical protein